MSVRRRRQGNAVLRAWALGPRERTWEQEHLALLDRNVTKVTIVHDTKEHIALVLVEPFLPTKQVSSEIHLNESLGI